MNITINIQGGSGNTMYTGPTQINHNPAPRQLEAPRADTGWTYHCKECGYTSHERKEFELQGEYGSRSYLCQRCDYQRDIKMLEEKSQSSRAAEYAEPIRVADDAEASRVIDGEYMVMDDYETVEANRTRPYYDPKVLRLKWAQAAQSALTIASCPTLANR